jgi:hypothetical protein
MKNIYAIFIFISILYSSKSIAINRNDNSDTLKNAIVYQIQFSNGANVITYQFAYSVQSSPKYLETDITKIITNIDLSVNTNNKDVIYLPNAQSSIILNPDNSLTLNTCSFKTFNYKGQKVVVKKLTTNNFAYSLPTI